MPVCPGRVPGVPRTAGLGTLRSPGVPGNGAMGGCRVEEFYHVQGRLGFNVKLWEKRV